MAVYFIPKNRLFSGHFSNANFIQNKWTSRWITIYKSSSNNSSSSQQIVNSNGKAIRHYSSNSTQSTQSSSTSTSSASQSTVSPRKAAGGWLTWSGLLLKWTPIGIGLATIVHWQLHNHKCDRNGHPRTASKWMTTVYCSLPLRLVSRTWGWLADCRVPIPMRPMVYGAYSTAFGVNIHEADNPNFKDYRSISEFFTRSLRPDVRTIHSASCLVSPVDGTVLHFGLSSGEQIEQVKGINYSLESFIGPLNEKTSKYLDAIRKNKNDETSLYQCVIYLAPGDYHRFHSPAEWQPEVRRHFHGELLSVSPKIAQWLPGLFCLNERALYMGQWDHGFFSFTAVGATNVGSVDVFIDEQLKTNRWHGFSVGKLNSANDFEEIVLPEKLRLSKGQLLGQFNMGSTVVLIFEAPKKFKFFIERGQKVKLGEPLGCINDIVNNNDITSVDNNNTSQKSSSL